MATRRAQSIFAAAIWLAYAAAAFAQQRTSTETFVRVDLNAEDWELSNQNASVVVESVRFPAMVLEALYDAGKLQSGDPISGYNDRTYAWVAAETWTFQTELNLTDSVLGQDKIDLVLSGVDTVAEVYVNDDLVMKLDNAHREFRLPVKRFLVEGTNTLSIVFHPAPPYAKMKASSYPYTVPMQTYVRGYDHYNFIRKPASDFGWDWGPAFAPSGVYGSISLDAYSVAYLTGCSIRQQHHDDGSVDVYFDAELAAPADGEYGTLHIGADEEEWAGSEDVLLRAGQNVVTVKVTIAGDYYLWWPVGFGAPFLYNFTVTYAANGSVAGQQGESTLSRRLGLRTIELVEDPIREPAGFSFYFRVNGVPTYARGANMIPLQIFHSQNSLAGYRALVEDAVAANMNMLRIWGGGLYQADAFYDLADEMGVLIWQEAMFACAQYPRDSAFLTNVAAEISYQARRLGHHASLAVWGGNNEVETAFEWFPESRANPKLFSVDYTALFVETVRAAVLGVDPGVAFVDSSPSKGVFSTDPYAKRWGNPSDVSAGDVHFYDYSSNCLDPAIYPRAKFVSEYGFQSFPSFSVYKRYTEARDWSIQSNMSDYRQRHPGGNSELQTQMQSHFLPIAANATNEGIQRRLFEQWIYLTQVQQSMCYETAIAHWRRLKAAPDARTMGVLYWQLNDIWAGPSWSGIDHGGHWKLLMYNVRKLFAPVAVSGTYNSSQADALSIYITNDQPWSVTGTVTAEIISWGARGYDRPVATKAFAFNVSALGSQVVGTMPVKSALQNASLSLLDGVVRLRGAASGNPRELRPQTCARNANDPFTAICTPAGGMTAPEPAPAPASPLGPSPAAAVSTQSISPAAAAADRRYYESDQVVWLSEPKAAAIALDPHISIDRVRQTDGRTASFKVSSRNVAAFVQLDTDVDGLFSDNGFLLVPWEPRTVVFRGRADFSAARLESSLTVMSLADTLSGGGFAGS